MAVAFQAVLIVVHAARQWLDTTGVLAAAIVLGLGEVDALTMSMARSAANGQLSADVAAFAIAAGIASNTVVKLAISLALGRGRFRILTSLTLAAIAASLVLVMIWLQ